MKNMYRPSIFLANFSYKSIRTFCSVLILWFFMIFVIDYVINTLFLNIHRIVNLEFDMKAWRFSPAEEWSWLIIHGFMSSLITGICVFTSILFEKKRIYQTQMIRAFKK
jgi:hypothetical protein